jgi:lysyl-tRNA synthetase class 2
VSSPKNGRSGPSDGPDERTATAWARRAPALATWTARLVALVGLINITSTVLPVSRDRLRLLVEVIPIIGVQTAGAVTAAVGVLLLLLANGLRRRKRRAWLAAVVLSGASVLLHLLKGLDVEEALLTAALLALLAITRDEFRAVGDRRSRWWAPTALVTILGIGMISGLTEVALRSRALIGDPPRWRWVEHVALGLIGIGGPLQFSRERVDDLVAITTGVYGLLAVGVFLYLLLMPGTKPPTMSEAEEDRLRCLLARHGRRDSLGYFALRPDKTLSWSPSGKAAVAYRVIGGVSLASGDPIGDPEAWPGAITVWLSESRRHAWVPAVLGCSEQAGTAYARFGFDAVELGDEAIVDSSAFSLDGRSMRGVRQAVNRVQRAGYKCTVERVHELGEDVVSDVARAANAFRDGDVERGFSMALGRLGDPADGACVLVVARDDSGRIRGLLNMVPWGPDGLSLDLMRRDPASENGLVEFMVVALLEAADRLGVTRMSLNFAVFRSVFARGERLGAGPVLRMWHRLLVVASRFWQIESLYRANAKYQPRWEPRFLCFVGTRDLPRIGLAALRAEAFLIAPPIVRRLVGAGALRPGHVPARPLEDAAGSTS